MNLTERFARCFQAMMSPSGSKRAKALTAQRRQAMGMVDHQWTIIGSHETCIRAVEQVRAVPEDAETLEFVVPASTYARCAGIARG